jgi:hypothetical protein
MRGRTVVLKTLLALRVIPAFHINLMTPMAENRVRNDVQCSQMRLLLTLLFL